MIDNIHTLGRNIHLEVVVSGLTEPGAKGKVIWREEETYELLANARPTDQAIPAKFERRAIERAFGLGDTSNEGKFILVS